MTLPELHENTIDQIRTLLMYLKQTELLKNKDILMCLDVIAREYGGVVVDKNWILDINLYKIRLYLFSNIFKSKLKKTKQY